jgi:hypothetical protein
LEEAVSDEPAIEVTPEMVQAGYEALLQHLWFVEGGPGEGDFKEAMPDIFRAMLAARIKP